MFCLLTLIVLSGLAVLQPLPLRQEPNTAVGNQESRQARETTLDWGHNAVRRDDAKEDQKLDRARHRQHTIDKAFPESVYSGGDYQTLGLV